MCFCIYSNLFVLFIKTHISTYHVHRRHSPTMNMCSSIMKYIMIQLWHIIIFIIVKVKVNIYQSWTFGRLQLTTCVDNIQTYTAIKCHAYYCICASTATLLDLRCIFICYNKLIIISQTGATHEPLGFSCCHFKL